MNNDKLFENPQKLSLPGFQKQEKYVDRMVVYPPEGLTVEEWYADFRKRFFDALENNRKFPVFRSSHGEFGFITGVVGAPPGWKPKIRYIFSRVYRILMFQSLFYSSGVPGHGYETYKQWRLPALRRKFAKQMKWIAENGVHCIYFSDRGAYRIKTQKKYLKWLNKNGIFLNRANYAHMYFVYALLNGYDRYTIFKGRRLLVVSSDQPARTRPLIENLKKMGVLSVDFISISPGRSMEDYIEPVTKEFDLCIVGAGVGAANVIYQLRDLNCPIIDAGFIIDRIAYPDKIKSRIYTIGDDIWDTVFPDNTPEWAKAFSDKLAFKN